MVMMNFLRALTDLGFYYSFAGIFSARAGGELALAALLVQSACFAISSALRRGRVARLAALVPGLFLLFLPVSLADRVVSVPPALYLAFLAWTDNYQLSWSRQVDQFNIFLRAFPVGGWTLALFGLWKPVFSTGIPAALITAAASVLLTRSLRHEPEVYLQPGYQFVNFASVLLLAFGALALGSEQAVRGAAFILGSIYNTVIVPLLLCAAMAVGYLLAWLVPLLKWLIGRFRSPGEERAMENTFEEFREELEKMEELLPVEPPEVFSRTVTAVGIILAAAALFLLFRWMARRYHKDGNRRMDQIRGDILVQPAAGWAPAGGGCAGRIRRQYRSFLRLCRRKGLEFTVSDTSTDIGEKALDRFPDEAAMADLRDLYQRARYQGKATREDCRRFKRLLDGLKRTGGSI